MSSELLPFRARGVGVGVLLVACLVLLMVAVEAHGSGEPAGEVGRAASLEVPATEALDTESLNRSLQEALATGQIWPTEPFASAAMLTGFSEAASLSIRGRWAGPEGTGPLTVVTVSDGFSTTPCVASGDGTSSSEARTAPGALSPPNERGDVGVGWTTASTSSPAPERRAARATVRSPPFETSSEMLLLAEDFHLVLLRSRDLVGGQEQLR